MLPFQNITLGKSTLILITPIIENRVGTDKMVQWVRRLPAGDELSLILKTARRKQYSRKWASDLRTHRHVHTTKKTSAIKIKNKEKRKKDIQESCSVWSPLSLTAHG